MSEDGPKQPIDVATVTARRELHFASLEDIRAEARRLVAAGDAVRPLGNLSLGRALGHLALLMHGCLDGMAIRVPPETRAFAMAHKEYILHNPMRAGVKLPPTGEARYIPGELKPGEGLARLEEGLSRLERETPTAEHAYLGPLTPEEWILLHCRHAELHLGFMQIEE